jgi:hypothetical protein
VLVLFLWAVIPHFNIAWELSIHFHFSSSHLPRLSVPLAWESSFPYYLLSLLRTR